MNCRLEEASGQNTLPAIGYAHPILTHNLMCLHHSVANKATVWAKSMESSFIWQLRLAVTTVLLLAAPLHGETIDTAGGSNCVGTGSVHPSLAARSDATSENSAKAVTSNNDTAYSSTPMPDKQRVKLAEHKDGRFSKQRLTQEDIIIHYKEVAVKNMMQPTRAPKKKSNPADQRECPRCPVSRSYLEHQIADCSPKRRRVEIRVGYCTKVVYTELCYGHCDTNAVVYLLKSTNEVKYYDVKRPCRSCRPSHGTNFKLVRLSCAGTKRNVVRIPLESSCKCRPCPGV
jgi:hypothetical protein